MEDLEKYKFGAYPLQETKLHKGVDINKKNNHLVCLQSESIQKGNGFFMSSKLFNYRHKYWKVSDRISLLQI